MPCKFTRECKRNILEMYIFILWKYQNLYMPTCLMIYRSTILSVHICYFIKRIKYVLEKVITILNFSSTMICVVTSHL